jgi:hypothetical protein
MATPPRSAGSGYHNAGLRNSGRWACRPCTHGRDRRWGARPGKPQGKRNDPPISRGAAPVARVGRPAPRSSLAAHCGLSTCSRSPGRRVLTAALLRRYGRNSKRQRASGGQCARGDAQGAGRRTRCLPPPQGRHQGAVVHPCGPGWRCRGERTPSPRSLQQLAAGPRPMTAWCCLRSVQSWHTGRHSEARGWPRSG